MKKLSIVIGLLLFSALIVGSANAGCPGNSCSSTDIVDDGDSDEKVSEYPTKKYVDNFIKEDKTEKKKLTKSYGGEDFAAEFHRNALEADIPAEIWKVDFENGNSAYLNILFTDDEPIILNVKGTKNCDGIDKLVTGCAEGKILKCESYWETCDQDYNSESKVEKLTLFEGKQDDTKEDDKKEYSWSKRDTVKESKKYDWSSDEGEDDENPFAIFDEKKDSEDNEEGLDIDDMTEEEKVEYILDLVDEDEQDNVINILKSLVEE